MLAVTSPSPSFDAHARPTGRSDGTNKLVGIFLNNIGTWLAAALVGLLTIFSDKILERIRFRLNRADLRVKQYEELAQDLSAYTFWVEVYQERYARGWTNNKNDLKAVGGLLNEAMVTLRTKEYVYWSWVRKYWGEVAARQFTEVIRVVKIVDRITHDFNDPEGWDETANRLGAELDILRSAIEKFLTDGLKEERPTLWFR
jgi:hypothetical protein